MIVEELIRISEIEFAYLFGSIVKKGIEKAEDVDIAIFFNERLSEENIIREKLNLESLLSVKTGMFFGIGPFINLT